MSLSRCAARGAPLGEAVSPVAPPGDPDDAPPPSRKRPRLEGPGSASEVEWRLPSAPRLSEAEKVRPSPPGAFRAPLVSAAVLLGRPTDARAGSPVSGAHVCNLPRCQGGECEMSSRVRPLPSASPDRGVGAPGGREAAGVRGPEAQGGPPSVRRRRRRRRAPCPWRRGERGWRTVLSPRARRGPGRPRLCKTGRKPILGYHLLQGNQVSVS
ncbi:RAD51-associated protein 2 [Vulpes lagopus]